MIDQRVRTGNPTKKRLGTSLEDDLIDGLRFAIKVAVGPSRKLHSEASAYQSQMGR